MYVTVEFSASADDIALATLPAEASDSVVLSQSTPLTPLQTNSSDIASSSAPNAQPADAFVNTLGINVHFSYDTTVYKILTKPAPSGHTVISALKSLGIRHIRDGAIDRRPDLCPAYRTVIANGANVDAITTTSTDAGALRTIANCLGSGLFAFEAPNELDLSGKSNWAQDDVIATAVIHSARGLSISSSGPNLWAVYHLGASLQSVSER